MAKILGTNIAAPVVPFDTADRFPSHEARYGKGGLRTVVSLVERNGIPPERQEKGMVVYVEDADQYFKLISTGFPLGDVNWAVWDGTSGGSNLEQQVQDLVALVTTLQAKLTATPKRHYVASMPAGITEIDLEPLGISYQPGANAVMFFANFVKQVEGESYVELSATKIQLTSPTEGGETFELYFYPFPMSGVEAL